MASILRLHVKREYFEKIKSGEKQKEYRSVEKWAKRIADRMYDYVYIYLGYPPKEDSSRVLKFEYNGYDKQTVSTDIYGDDVSVFAIELSKRVLNGCEV